MMRMQSNDLAWMLKVRTLWPICSHVHLSKLFAILIAAAMLFAPFAMQSGSAMAAMPSGHHGEMMSKDHCDGQPAADADAGAADSPCCAAMCTAVAIPARQSEPEQVFVPLPAIPLAASQYRSVLGEIATQPPRLA